MSVIALIENTFFATCRYWGGLNDSLRAFGPIEAMQTGIDSADLNMVWSENPLMREDARFFPEIKKYYDENALPFWWWIFPSAKSPETNSLLRDADYHLAVSTPCLLADLQELPDREIRDKTLTVNPVKSKEELALWRDVSFAGFDFPPHTRSQYDRFTAAFDLTSGSPQKLLLAREKNGKPVATSLVYLKEGTAGIYFVTTLVEKRRQGIGLILTQATLHFARSQGARFATLQSSPEGLHVYERAGFREFGQVDVYALNDR